MNPKSLHTLEYDKIIARLAALGETAPGRALALDLLPSSDYDEVVRRQRLTAEARRLLGMKPNVSLAAARDIVEPVRQAALGHVLEPAELLDVQATLALARSLHDTIDRLRLPAGRQASGLPLLSATADGIGDFRDLAAGIARCIDPRGEVVDGASPVLAQLRRDARVAHDRLARRLQQLVASSAVRPALQEPIVTLRDGRYVIPVKAEIRGHIPGIVHDVSASGATVFLEPLEVVEQGNAWRELQAEEQREVRRILRDLSARVGERSAEIAAALAALAGIDLSLAKAKLGGAMAAQDLPSEGDDQSWLVRPPAELRLVDARHPLLTGEAVPITVWVGDSAARSRRKRPESDGFSALLITGPNTGGKTVALKTVGLLALMAQAGLPIPAAQGSRLPVFDAVFADIGDEQSIEQSLSTFSSHVGNIVSILAAATRHSLVLLDELGAGTDPAEGSALAKAILTRLLRAGCLTIATTHHGELKAFAHITPGIVNASVEFDPETLAPTYRLNIGLPGQSNALAIAQRLGMPGEVLEEARQAIGEDRLAVESLIVDLQRQREAAESARLSQEAAAAEAERARRQVSDKLAALESGRDRLLEETRRQMEGELSEARARLRQTLRDLERAERLPFALSLSKGERAAAIEAAQVEVAAVEKTVEKLERRRRRRPLPAIAPGDRLYLRDLPLPGEALSAPDPTTGEVEVKLGALRARVSVKQVERVEKPEPPATAGRAVPPARPEPIEGRGVAPELHVRGLAVDEAIPLIDQRLDEAFRAGVESLRIVHGKGTGTLRRAVRDLLSKHPLVRGHAAAAPRQGGDGVTVVELAT